MSILENVKEAADLALKYKDQDLYERILSLREEITELREVNINQREELKALKESIAVSVHVTRQGNCYFLDDDVDRERPYCLTCWDADRKLISLIQTNSMYGGGRSIKCGVCDKRKFK